MKKDKIPYFYNWFENYVNKFYCKDSYINQNIKLKEDHTLRVCKHIIGISKSLNLCENDILLAEVLALFHDIGRFEQFQKYRTFNDKKSVNHAELGIEIIKKKNLFSKLPQEEKKLIIKAIKFHNMIKLPDKRDDRIIFFSKLIRDADKLDIFYVLTSYYSSKDNGSNPALDLDRPDTEEYSKEIIKDILENKSSNLKHVKTINDFKLLQVSWIFDINFSYSIKHIVKKKYIEKIINTLPHLAPIQQTSIHINDYISNKFGIPKTH